MSDQFGPTVYVEATLPTQTELQTIGYGTRAQFARRYGNHITDKQILEARFGYMPIGATVHELDWEKQFNAPMTIKVKENGDY